MTKNTTRQEILPPENTLELPPELALLLLMALVTGDHGSIGIRLEGGKPIYRERA